ncbi:MAG: ribbon-helix-helix protein, CopG family [Ruminococcaceae bacterium]|nr:ribbon-helix-helix protein, CopG family [Oscillospiraceae bacterium]
MSDKKLTLRPHKYNGESTVISMRLPKDMLAEIDKVAADTGRTRNEILILCMEFALENIQITEN